MITIGGINTDEDQNIYKSDMKFCFSRSNDFLLSNSNLLYKVTQTLKHFLATTPVTIVNEKVQRGTLGTAGLPSIGLVSTIAKKKSLLPDHLKGPQQF